MFMQKRKGRNLLSALTIGAMLGVVLVAPSEAAEAAPLPVSIQVHTNEDRQEISPYIYGTNASASLTGNEGFTARRLGGNRMTGYNWENNASNAGSDWLHQSDEYLCSEFALSPSECEIPGKVQSTFHDQSLAQGAYTVLTLPMAGYVARDKAGPVDVSETAPSARWDQIEFAKQAPFQLQPDLNDGVVYMDEFVNFMVHHYGDAQSSTGVKGYSLDNEPGLWSHTHARIHPDPVGAVELVDRSVGMAKAVKAVDPHAEIFGGVFYGFNAYYSLQDAPDWAAVKGSYNWYVDYYLDQLKQASQDEGQRLLDVLDVHWYPEAQGGGQRITFSGVGNVETQKARLQAPRTLWDPTYVEDSWIAQYFSDYLPILPRLKQSIDQYYPGTKLAITEFSYGGEGHISGGLALADALGIFGKYGVYMANFWRLEADTSYVSAAYQLYRNYDGDDSTFGDISVRSATSDIENSSVHASVTEETGKLHLIVMNKNTDTPLQADFTIAGNQQYNAGSVYGFDSSSSELFEAAPIAQISNNEFSYTIPPLTAYHIVLSADSEEPGEVPAAPVNLIAEAGDNEVTLHWSASDGASSYTVKRSMDGGNTFELLAANVIATTYTDASAINGTTYHYVVSAVNQAGESPNSNPASATPTDSSGSSGELVLQYREADRDPTNNQIKAHFNIKNTGSETVELEDLKIRYYFSKEGAAAMNSWIDWAQVGGHNIERDFTDAYVELTFKPGTGSLAAGGQSGEIQLRMSKADWTNFDETNDYSYDPAKTSFEDWDKVTLYLHDKLVWGIEP
nr:glycoside hydrolase family 44 protein [Xylanibacillus composti]